jgi:flagellar basal-body rod protein FlgG
MAIIALHSAASGLRALSTQIDVLSNNLSNAETQGFKRSRVNFADLMYLMQRQPGTANSVNDNLAPTGIFVGLGTKVDNTQVDFTQGSLDQTGQPLDIAIQGNGFFAVKLLPGVGDGIGFTRAGNFFLNKSSELVLGSGEGYRLVPPIQIPTGATSINIGQDGTVQITQAGNSAKTTVGQLQLSQFVNPEGLNLLGGNIYLATDASGPPISSKPGQDGAGVLQEGFLEHSNVDPVTELVTMIQTQRAFEMNSQSIQTADQALQTVANLRRG